MGLKIDTMLKKHGLACFIQQGTKHAILEKKIITETNISETPDTKLINKLTVRPNKQQQEPKLSSQ
jgi:hypothetical protein